MPTSTDLPPDRLAIGQLLVRLLREFRIELFAPAATHGYADMRQPYMHVFGNVGIDGVRLTDLAARAQLSLATTSELVSQLQQLGYLERRPDPRDGRATGSASCRGVAVRSSQGRYRGDRARRE